MSPNPKPVAGLGGGVAATGTAGIMATQLPVTGPSMTAVVALAVVAGLIVWAAVYMLLRRKKA